MIRTTAFGLIICLVLSASHVNSARADDQPVKRLKVGVVLGLTGHASVHSENMRRGIELAKRDLESQGWKVELAYEDDGTQAAKSLSAVQSLIAKGYRLFIGPAWSYLVAAAGPVYLRADVVAYAPATCSEVAGGPNAHVFHGVTPSSAKTPVLADWLKKKGFKKVAILLAASGWADVHRRVYMEAAEAAGAQVVFDDHFEYGQERTVLPVLIERMKMSAPEVILSTSSAEGSAVAVRKLKELQIRSAFLSTDDVVDAVQQRLLEPADAGLPLFALVIPVAEPFKKRYRAYFGQEAGVYSDSAYDGLMMFAAAQQNTASPGEMRTFIRERMNYEGASGRFHYDRNGDVVKHPYQVIALNQP